MFNGQSYEQQRLLPAHVEDRLIAWAGRVTGFVLLGVLAILWLSVLSWQLTDPSLTHATGGRAQNWLGGLGAILSDLLLQTLGFATAIALLAPMFWGLELAIGERVLYFRSKAAYYPLSVLALAGALSSLPVAESWPLHHGYGGILGDLVYSLGTTLFNLLNPDRAGLAAGLLFAIAGLSALIQSLGVPLREIGLALASPLALDRITGARGSRGSWHQNLKAEAERLTDGLKGFGRSPAPAPGTGSEAGHEPGYNGGDTYETGAPGQFEQPQPHEDWTLRRDDHDFPPFEAAGRRMPPAPMPLFRGGPMPPPPGPREPFTASAYPAEPRPVAADPRAQQGEAPQGREQMFDASTEDMSRFIAERFAPPGSQILPIPPRAREPQRAAPRSTLLGGLGFRKPKGEYRRPSPNLLKRPAAPRPSPELTQTVLRGNAGLLQDVLKDFGVNGEVREIKPGPVVTLFEFEPARGTKSSRVIALSDDIARSMSAQSVRVAVVPGRNAIGIELPNMRREPVLLREMLESTAFRASDAALPLALGKSIGGEPVVADLARMPHLLVAGTTGSGKSVGVNAMILSLLYRHGPEECRFLMIDPKMLELSVYNGIPHLLTPVVTDPKKAVSALNWVVAEMEERYKRMSKLSVRNIDVYNNRVRTAAKRGEMLSRTVQTGFDRATGQAVYEKQSMELEPMPYIVVVIDEFADLMIVAGKEIEALVQRLAQMARAAGIHLIMATQRPSVDVITGTIKANFPTRISFKVTSKIDSRTILNDQGAEQLLGQGDMLYAAGGGQHVRVHGPFVADEEVESIAQFLREQGEPNYVEGILETPASDSAAADGEDRETGEDDVFDRAVAVVLRDRKASTSYIQRRLSIGYNRAADLIERMEREGIVSPANHAGKREILGSGAGAGGYED